MPNWISSPFKGWLRVIPQKLFFYSLYNKRAKDGMYRLTLFSHLIYSLRKLSERDAMTSLNSGLYG